ncbi:MAG: RNA 2',3'-cyclic phosphodiesterase [Acidobacteria bacterium]|nr:RNA 2',3'-cyclic phosphodiesterase [Acidobacteriota bacterium]
MRLFVGLDIPEDITGTLDRLVNQLRPAAKVNWSRPANLHITTKFIGEWPPERLGEMKQALAAVPRLSAIDIEVRALGWFPNPHHPKVFFAAIHASPLLARLASETEKAAATLGVPTENRPYSPHLTLARIKTPVDLSAVRQAVAALPSLEFGRFTADRFFLYLSELRPPGPVYSKLAGFPLT